MIKVLVELWAPGHRVPEVLAGSPLSASLSAGWWVPGLAAGWGAGARDGSTRRKPPFAWCLMSGQRPHPCTPLRRQDTRWVLMRPERKQPAPRQPAGRAWVRAMVVCTRARVPGRQGLRPPAPWPRGNGWQSAWEQKAEESGSRVLAPRQILLSLPARTPPSLWRQRHWAGLPSGRLAHG